MCLNELRGFYNFIFMYKLYIVCVTLLDFMFVYMYICFRGTYGRPAFTAKCAVLFK